MIITQRFNSVNEIEAELIPSIEDLLSNCIPDFQLLKDYEQNAPEDINFAYYLFFGNTTNAPIGYAQIELKNEKPIKPSFFKRVLRKDPVKQVFEKSVKWKIPGSLQEGIVFRPTYIKHACLKAQDIFNELFERDDIISQEIKYSQGYKEMEKLRTSDLSNEQSFRVADTLIKNKDCYKTFFESLSSKTQVELKASWKTIQKELGYKLGDYSSFKKCFEYKSQGPTQYKELKKDPRLQKYLSEDSQASFLTLESEEEIKAFLIYSIGKTGNSFYDIIFTSPEVPKLILHQLAIIKYYDSPKSNRLHHLGDLSVSQHLIDLGYTAREQFSIEVTKLKQ